MWKHLLRICGTARSPGRERGQLHGLLNDFLRDPQGMVPGTSMVFPGIDDDRQRAELVDYVMAKSKVGGL